MKFKKYVVSAENYVNGQIMTEQTFYRRKEALEAYNKIASRVYNVSSKRKNDVVLIVFLIGIDENDIYWVLRRKGGLK